MYPAQVMRIKVRLRIAKLAEILVFFCSIKIYQDLKRCRLEMISDTRLFVGSSSNAVPPRSFAATFSSRHRVLTLSLREKEC